MFKRPSYLIAAAAAAVAAVMTSWDSFLPAGWAFHIEKTIVWMLFIPVVLGRAFSGMFSAHTHTDLFQITQFGYFVGLFLEIWIILRTIIKGYSWIKAVVRRFNMAETRARTLREK